MLTTADRIAGPVVLSALRPCRRRATRPGITVDKDKKTVTIDAKIAPRKLADSSRQGLSRSR